MGESTGARRITGSELGTRQEAIERACKVAGLSKGDPIVVSWQGEGYLYYCEGSGADDTDGTSYPNCPFQVCDTFRMQIREICREAGWPPGQPILIYLPEDDSFCLCYCR